VSKKQSHLPKLAFFLLQKLYPRPTREPLMGDLLEQFKEGRSNGWLWRQVLAALGVAAFRQLRLILPEICVVAAAVTAICVFPWGLIFPVETMDKPNGTEWILNILAVEALTGLVVWPLFAAFLMLRKAFTWDQSLQISALTSALLLGGDALLREWSLRHAVQQPSNAILLVRLQVLCIIIALLISIAFARRISLRRKSAN
jgi:hypothetical protein